MAVAVVHVLETVEVEQQHSDVLATGSRLQHSLLQLVAEPRAVGQPRERIVVRQKLQPLLLHLFFRNVGEHAHVVRDLPGRVAHGRQGHVLWKHLAVLAAVPDLALPVARLAQGAPHGVVERLVMPARLEDARRLAQQFFLGITQQAGHRGVGRQDAALRIGHHHALHGVVHHRGGQTLAGLAVLECGAGGLDLVQVLQNADHMGGLGIRLGDQRYRAQHGHLAPIARTQAFVLTHIVVDLARQQARQLGSHPVTVGRHQHIANIQAADPLQRRAEQITQAGVGPQEPPVWRRARDTCRHVAHDLRQLPGHGQAHLFGVAHAAQQAPGQPTGQQHVAPALPGLKAREQHRVAHPPGQQRVAHEHPGHPQHQVQQHSPPGDNTRRIARIGH